MKKNHFLLTFILFPALFSCSNSEIKDRNSNALNKAFTLYSETVKDSFYISVQLPVNYYTDTATNYPVVYLLDANFHFPILSSAIRQYEKGGLLPPMILVGIGYKSFREMDSLRVRDYMYPASLPSDEMTAVGGGRNFYTFISKHLIPNIDSTYKTETTTRSLLGHSFGGYFSLYALLNQLQTNQSAFKSFASASPSLWYNNYYLNQLPDRLRTNKSKDTLNIFLTVGGLEDSTWSIRPVKNLGSSITNAKIKNIKLQHKIYSDLEHMDVSTITFMKALEVFYPKSKTGTKP